MNLSTTIVVGSGLSENFHQLDAREISSTIRGLRPSTNSFKNISYCSTFISYDLGISLKILKIISLRLSTLFKDPPFFITSINTPIPPFLYI